MSSCERTPRASPPAAFAFVRCESPVACGKKIFTKERRQMKLIRITTILVAVVALCGALSRTNLRPATANTRSNILQDRDPQKPLQSAVASKTAKFATIEKDDVVYKNALDAHDLAGAKNMTGKDGAFKGTVANIYEERDGDMLILNFDLQYRNALSAVLRNADFPKFPDMKALKDKEVVVTGKFVDY